MHLGTQGSTDTGSSGCRVNSFQLAYPSDSILSEMDPDIMPFTLFSWDKTVPCIRDFNRTPTTQLSRMPTTARRRVQYAAVCVCRTHSLSGREAAAGGKNPQRKPRRRK